MRREEDNIKMDLEETGCGVVDGIHLAHYTDQCRVPVNIRINRTVP
jgi:hypothetical protein